MGNLTPGACMLRVVITFTDGTVLPLLCHSLDVAFAAGRVYIRFIPPPGDPVAYLAATIATIHVEPAT